RRFVHEVSAVDEDHRHPRVSPALRLRISRHRPVVKSWSEEAKAFYLRLGLDQSPLDSMTLMVTLSRRSVGGCPLRRTVVYPSGSCARKSVGYRSRGPF